MRARIKVRYVDFTWARNGNRVFNFVISTQEQLDALVSVELPMALVVGADRIRLQDGAGLSYAKLNHMVALGQAKVPRRLCLTALDVAEFRSS